MILNSPNHFGLFLVIIFENVRLGCYEPVFQDDTVLFW